MGFYFDLTDLQREMTDSYLCSQRFESILTFKVNSLKELCGRLPEEDEAFFIETKKSFTAFTFIVYVVKWTGRVDHLYIATYSTNERIINALLRWREKGVLGDIHLHVSETLQFRMPKVFARLVELHRSGVITLTYSWSHKKITCLDTPRGQFVVEGSGNYGENSMEEQYVFLKNRKVYEFRSNRIQPMGEGS